MLAAYALKRLCLAAATVVAATLLTFVLLRLVPGEPASVVLRRVFIQDMTASVDPADVAAVARRFGLDAPILVQYWNWLTGAVTGDFGTSYRTSRPVITEIGARLGNTALLAALASAVSLVFAVALVALQHLARRRAVKLAVDAISVASIALPSFYLGVVLVIALSLRLDLLPVSGFATWAHVVLPVTVLAAGQVGFTIVVLSGALRETYSAPFIVTARAKGLAERDIFFHHALRNALVPLVPYLALQFAFLVGGVLVVERLFAIPGLGAYLTDALDSHDGPAFLGAIAVVALAVAVCNLVADFLIAILDPRIVLGRGPAR